MNVQSKWLCQSKEEIAYKSSYGDVAYRVSFIPVWEGTTEDGKPASEQNRIFGDATPAGNLSMTICNPNAAAAYRAGQCYVFTSEHAGLQESLYYGYRSIGNGQYLDPTTGEKVSFDVADARRRANSK